MLKVAVQDKKARARLRLLLQPSLMGLTIHWKLSAPGELPETAVKEFAARTAEFASRIGCQKVFQPKCGGPDDCRLLQLPNGDTTGDFFPAESGWSVMILPGDGSEPAQFGLCRYPGDKQWKLSCACKTQYAALHGWEHFLVCHQRIVNLLDLWRDFGIDVKVNDEGEFWETRSARRLRERLRLYDRLVAAVAGALKDDRDKGSKGVRAEIFNDPRFERLEAEGCAEFNAKIAELRMAVQDEVRRLKDG
jgi:hypothetical protein